MVCKRLLRKITYISRYIFQMIKFGELVNPVTYSTRYFRRVLNEAVKTAIFQPPVKSCSIAQVIEILCSLHFLNPRLLDARRQENDRG